MLIDQHRRPLCRSGSDPDPPDTEPPPLYQSGVMTEFCLASESCVGG